MDGRVLAFATAASKALRSTAPRSIRSPTIKAGDEVMPSAQASVWFSSSAFVIAGSFMSARRRSISRPANLAAMITDDSVSCEGL